ncbi:uncharacterized protein LOC111642689 [Centruroides sculpturatus]|uniref:uncharacterized protein LOC111642689 n=1 Tax=Centruroides sculpturatus TaxID=218467 RepID=UPI000C6E9889|nr:uncharacterized protein LOC111642689 [Centruroides sculpturatus]
MLKENVTFICDSNSSRDVDGENKNVDLMYLNNTLLPKVGDALVETTRKRKLYPEEYRTIVTKQLKLEAEKLRAKEYRVERGIDFKDLLRNDTDDGEKLMIEVSSQMQSHIQMIQEKIEKIERLKECFTAFKQMEECKTDRMVFRESIISPTDERDIRLSQHTKKI